MRSSGQTSDRTFALAFAIAFALAIPLALAIALAIALALAFAFALAIALALATPFALALAIPFALAFALAPMPPMPPSLARYPVVFALPVQWGDMDELGHVNNVIYLRWFESARMEYFVRARLWDGVRSAGVGPILARTTIDYRRPISYPDDVRCACTVLKLGNTSITMGMRVFSRRHARAIAAEGEAVLVMVDYKSGAKVPLSEELRNAIEQLEASAARDADPPQH